MKTNVGVYKITNIKNNKVYIGSSVNLKSRKYDHFGGLESNRHKNSHLQSSYNKHGKENFIWEVLSYLEFVEDTSILKNNLLEKEQYWIDKYKEEGIILYNLCPRADSPLGMKLSREARIKIGNCKRGIKLSEEHKEKIGLANKNKKLSEEHKEKIRQVNLGRKRSSETIAKLKEAKKNISKETREKMSASMKGRVPHNKGKKHSEETCKKISNSMKGNSCRKDAVLSKDHLEKISKKVINITTGEVFNSAMEASRFYGIGFGSICRVCRRERKTYKGFEWAYYLED